ncbi:MAG TPA: C1 family peptidase [bacterium]|nr:C1 family peptidase [bacterium]HPQ66979.1 C1 family peptidase [bacterium]
MLVCAFAIFAVSAPLPRAEAAGPTPEDQALLEEMRQEIAAQGYGFTVDWDPHLNSDAWFTPDRSAKDRLPRALPPRTAAPLPTAFSWADYDALTPVRDQGYVCAGGWAFAMGGVVESLFKMSYGLDLDISEQWIIECNTLGYDCIPSHDAYFCYQFLCDQPALDGEAGIVPESEFFYADTDVLPCSTNYPYLKVGRLDSFLLVGDDGDLSDPEPRVEDIKRAIYETGPVSVMLGADIYFSGYSGGIFDYDIREPEAVQAVVLYGWDDSQGDHGVWFLRNSFGTGWGEPMSYSTGISPGPDRGYMRIAYGASRVGIDAQYAEFQPSTQRRSYSVRRFENDFTGGGTAQNWKADEALWQYALPFTFPFYRRPYNNIWVSSNGYISFSAGTCLWNADIDTLRSTRMIAPFWIDLSTADTGRDIYIDEQTDNVTIRWNAIQPGLPTIAIQAELILNRDGSFQINYGDGNIFAGFYPVVGFSDGNGIDFQLTDCNGRWNLQSDFPETNNYTGAFCPGVLKSRRVLSRTFTPISSAAGIVDGDYSGNGKSDIAVLRSYRGKWSIRGFSNVYYGAAGDLPVSGDYDGDGTADIAVFRPSTGLWAVRGVTAAYYGILGDKAVPADYNGDGKTDIAVFRPDTAAWSVRNLSHFYHGKRMDVPLPGDYNGDGRAEAAVYRPLTGGWMIRGMGSRWLGTYGDIPVPGDYSGDGSTYPAIFRPSSGLWVIQGLSRLYFGAPGDSPVPLDYSGVDALRLGIFRPSSGLWVVRQVTRAYFGATGDTPVTK